MTNLKTHPHPLVILCHTKRAPPPTPAYLHIENLYLLIYFCWAPPHSHEISFLDMLWQQLFFLCRAVRPNNLGVIHFITSIQLVTIAVYFNFTMSNWITFVMLLIIGDIINLCILNDHSESSKSVCTTHFLW